MGDVVGIVHNGQLVAHYTYDAWGTCTILKDSAIAQLNPIRYRGYYYDTETGLYYCLTRYYNPTFGSFISPDTVDYLDPESINGLNLYAYCNNNPVMCYDPSGHSAILIGLLAGAIVGGMLGGITAYSNGQDVLSGIITGALLGATVGLVVGIGGAALSSAVSSTLSKTMTDLMSVAFYGGEFGSWEDYAIAFAFGGLSGALGSITGKFAGLAKGTKFVADVAVRPLVTQLVKKETRGDPFSGEKYLYSVVTRAVTYRGSQITLEPYMLKLDLRVDLGKVFYRATFNGIYD